MAAKTQRTCSVECRRVRRRKLAKRRRAILLTRDQDFLGFLPSQHSGIVIIRIHPSIAETITNAVDVLLAAHGERWLRGKVLVLLPNGYEVIR